jgi:DNA/RNA-binding domain of Phe-tRNA-synthetase-like protein
MVTLEPHPLLDAACFTATFPQPMSALGRSDELMNLLEVDAKALFTSSDEIRGAVRELLRHGGYKPTGRGKPASEYLIRAVTENALSSINVVVDACNVASLHSGLPISVVDLALAKPPFTIKLAPAGTEYVFNKGGQTIDVAGLLCLFDADGACANAVKDSQRTKTTPETTSVLVVVWGTKDVPGRAAKAAEWYRELLKPFGAVCAVV